MKDTSNNLLAPISSVRVELSEDEISSFREIINGLRISDAAKEQLTKMLDSNSSDFLNALDGYTEA